MSCPTVTSIHKQKKLYTRISKHKSAFLDNEPTIDALLEQLRMELALFCVKIGRTRDLL